MSGRGAGGRRRTAMSGSPSSLQNRLARLVTQLRGCGFGAVGRRGDGRENLNNDSARAWQSAFGGQRDARAFDRRGYHWDSRPGRRSGTRPYETSAVPGSRGKVPSGKNTSEFPLTALRSTRRASAAPRLRLNRSTNSEPSRRSSRPARGTLFISRLMTKPKRGGSAAVNTTPSM